MKMWNRKCYAGNLLTMFCSCCALCATLERDDRRRDEEWSAGRLENTLAQVQTSLKLQVFFNKLSLRCCYKLLVILLVFFSPMFSSSVVRFVAISNIVIFCFVWLDGGGDKLWKVVWNKITNVPAATQSVIPSTRVRQSASHPHTSQAIQQCIALQFGK